MMPMLRRAPWALALLLVACQHGASSYSAPRTSAQEAHARIAHGEPITIVDVRSEVAYQHEHIAGAVDLPFMTLKSAHVTLPKDRTLLLYCT